MTPIFVHGPWPDYARSLRGEEWFSVLKNGRKSVMTVDVLSKGRFDFGVGIGWNRAEFDATATPWPDRGTRTDDYLQVMRSLWTDDPSSFSGTFYTLEPCHLHPKPVQQPHPPNSRLRA